MDRPSRKSQHNARVRARLLQAATELFQAQGSRAATIDAICRGAGLTRGAFYTHFPSKAAILEIAARSDPPLLTALKQRSDAAPNVLWLGLRYLLDAVLSAEGRAPDGIEEGVQGRALVLGVGADRATTSKPVEAVSGVDLRPSHRSEPCAGNNATEDVELNLGFPRDTSLHAFQRETLDDRDISLTKSEPRSDGERFCKASCAIHDAILAEMARDAPVPAGHPVFAQIWSLLIGAQQVARAHPAGMPRRQITESAKQAIEILLADAERTARAGGKVVSPATGV